jgi:hypothetical protein
MNALFCGAAGYILTGFTRILTLVAGGAAGKMQAEGVGIASVG